MQQTKIIQSTKMWYVKSVVSIIHDISVPIANFLMTSPCSFLKILYKSVNQLNIPAKTNWQSHHMNKMAHILPHICSNYIIC